MPVVTISSTKKRLRERDEIAAKLAGLIQGTKLYREFDARTVVRALNHQRLIVLSIPYRNVADVLKYCGGESCIFVRAIHLLDPVHHPEGNDPLFELIRFTLIDINRPHKKIGQKFVSLIENAWPAFRAPP